MKDWNIDLMTEYTGFEDENCGEEIDFFSDEFDEEFFSLGVAI